MERPLPNIAVETGLWRTGNVEALLHEIRHGLRRLLETGEETAIDLRALPMAPGEEDQIEQALGTGELRAILDALGPSDIRETRYPGVWLITHYNQEGEIMGRFIEIARVPDVLKAPEADVRDGLRSLESRLRGETDA